MSRGQLHHIELWVPHLDEAVFSLGWLFESLGYVPFQSWKNGRSWLLGNTYIVVEQSPALTSNIHDRLRPGLNHLAFNAGTVREVDALTLSAVAHSWTILFSDTHPYAGGEEHYAAYLSNGDGFEVELIAQSLDS